MKKRLFRLSSNTISGEAGQALILVLVFLLLGSLMLPPVLAHINTTLKTGMAYEEKTDVLNAADAGIDDGIWRIKTNYWGGEIHSQTYNKYDFSTNFSYNTDIVNAMTANVSIHNVWIPTTSTPGDYGYSTTQVQNLMESATNTTYPKLMVTGTANVSSGKHYTIKIYFSPAAGEENALMISSVGVWLPIGFEYDGECNMESYSPLDFYYLDPSVTDHCGGTAVVWDLASSANISYFPGFETLNGVQYCEMTFKYKPTGSVDRPAAVSWITADNNVSNILPVTWDIDTRIFQIKSVAQDTTIEAYSTKCESRALSKAISGDYKAFGNTLIYDTGSDGREKWVNLTHDSEMSVSDIPNSESEGYADVVAAYLYWSAWKNSTFANTVWGLDACSNMDNWDMSSQTRVPTADGYTSGTWSPATTCYEMVNETTPVDTDYMTGTSSGYQLFTFPAFSIPDEATIQDITIFVRAQKTGTGTSDIRPAIQVNGNRYYYPTGSSGYNPPNQPAWTTYSYSWTTNPASPGGTSPWTVDDIKGLSTRPLQQFGVYSNDCSPNVLVSMVYARVNYSCWSVYSNTFRGHFSSGAESARYLEMKNPVNLTGYTPGSLIVEWLQWAKQGTYLELNDSLKFQFSSNNGTSWDTPVTAFYENINRGDTTKHYFYYTIPTQYFTSSTFKFRFYLDGFTDSDEYCYLDDIGIGQVVGTADTQATLTIDAPLTAPFSVTVNATKSSVIGNCGPTDYSYASKADITDLVKAHAEIIEDAYGVEHQTGNGTYTVGGVDCTPANHNWAYAGWSIVIIYGCPDTAGRQIYLYDDFIYADDDTDVDFDGDGKWGGDITGFKVPTQIAGDTVAAKITCFVGEGDSGLSNDFIALNAPESTRSNPWSLITSDYKLWDSTGDKATNINNVWNSKSIGLTKDGVDIDTFYILWDDYLIETNDTTAHFDLPTKQDSWNLVYTILSVRSKTTTGGTGHYVIYGN